MPGLTPTMRAAMATFKRDTALNERITDAYNKFNKEVPYDRQVPLAAWKELPEGKAAVAAILAGAGASSSGAASAGLSDSIRATPEANPIIASFARGLKSADTFARKPFGYDNPPAAAISSLLGVPAIQRTMERVGYGEPLTNVGKANVPLMTEDTGEALMAAPQFLSPAAKLAQMTKGLPVGASVRNFDPARRSLMALPSAVEKEIAIRSTSIPSVADDLTPAPLSGALTTIANGVMGAPSRRGFLKQASSMALRNALPEITASVAPAVLNSVAPAIARQAVSSAVAPTIGSFESIFPAVVNAIKKTAKHPNVDKILKEQYPGVGGLDELSPYEVFSMVQDAEAVPVFNSLLQQYLAQHVPPTELKAHGINTKSVNNLLDSLWQSQIDQDSAYDIAKHADLADALIPGHYAKPKTLVLDTIGASFPKVTRVQGFDSIDSSLGQLVGEAKYSVKQARSDEQLLDTLSNRDANAFYQMQDYNPEQLGKVVYDYAQKLRDQLPLRNRSLADRAKAMIDLENYRNVKGTTLDILDDISVNDYKAGGSVQPQMSLADYFKANVPVPMVESEGQALRSRFPQTYGALAGLLGTPPDEMSGSVLEPGYKDRKAGADKTFALGTLLQMLPMAPATKGLPVGAIIRNTGDNNFLKGSVENALSRLKKPITTARLADYTPEQAAAMLASGRPARNDSLNKFVEGPLTRYVKQQMATPDDPVRALAESGVTHKDMTDAGYGLLSSLEDTRMAAKFPIEGVGKSDLARGWETNADMAIRPAGTAKQILDDASTPFGSVLGKAWAKDNSWLQKVPPETKVFTATPEMRDLGFDHLTDELRNALNPESGLPRNLLLTPEKLQNFGMEKAVRHVAAINDWRAAQVAEANAQKANNAATVLYKEYPHTDTTPNPKNLRWVELKAQDGLPEGYTVRPATIGTSKAQRSGFAVFRPDGSRISVAYGPTEGDALRSYHETAFGVHADQRRAALSDALKYEGDTMKHCVGGYTDDVLSGKKRIFSLRDAKGEPHVTIHTEPSDWFTEMSKRSLDDSKAFNTQFKTKLAEAGLDPKGRGPEATQLGNAVYADLFGEAPAPTIVQIKRKANLVNSDPYEYRPFVQDFVKSGKWSDVGDMANTGMQHINAPMELIKGSGKTIGPGWYTPEEINKHLVDSGVDASRLEVKPRGFATGGRVSMIHPAAAIQPLVRVPGFDRF